MPATKSQQPRHYGPRAVQPCVKIALAMAEVEAT
jgi:hypothetical protein